MAQELKPVKSAFDHLLLGVSDLDYGIRWVEERTGVKAAIGGIHPGAGTRNALLSLGPGHYLEIIAPDPAQTAFNFQIDIRGLKEPRIITFAAVTGNIETTAGEARKAGHQVFGPRDGSRKTPSGEMLKWRTLSVMANLRSNIVNPVPFFIQWEAGSAHPSTTAPQGCALESLEFEHPDPARLQAIFKALALTAGVSQGESPRIIASLRTPKGPLQLS